MLIVNADDFGLSESVNSAILEAFRLGLISSTTIMANMPGFEQACELAHRHQLSEHIGIHLVFDCGAPLAAQIHDQPTLCGADGGLSPQFGRRHIRLSRGERMAIEAELTAQIARCRAHGLKLTHLDSHHHLHTTPAFAPAVFAVAKRERIPHVRIARNTRARENILMRLYKFGFNARLTNLGFRRTDAFGSAGEVQARGAAWQARHSIEVMVHPAWDSSGTLIDAGTGLLSEGLRSIQGVASAVSYSGARRKSA